MSKVNKNIKTLKINKSENWEKINNVILKKNIETYKTIAKIETIKEVKMTVGESLRLEKFIELRNLGEDLFNFARLNGIDGELVKVNDFLKKNATKQEMLEIDKYCKY